MQIERYEIWKEKEYTFPNRTAFQPNIAAYLHEEAQNRPAILITPGGGYCCVSCTEGEIVAKTFWEKGYQTFVLTYTTDLLMEHPLGLQPLKDLARAMVFLRKNAEKFRIFPDRIAVCGFSAGGHLSGSLAVHYGREELREKGVYEGISVRPDAAILCYPVITAGVFAHRDSFTALLGADADEEALQGMSLEKWVTKETPPLFLWHCETDEAVPVENSLLMERACREAGVPVEMHLFGSGKHGMSVATEEWSSGAYTGLYTMQQFFDTLQDLADRGEPLPAPFDTIPMPEGMGVKEFYLKAVEEFRRDDRPDEAVAMWPGLADLWLRRLWA
ncbi:MAG: alpha/beta hydrolase [Eubacteriales bacterium]|nr:alpha/beta hydrolase [Eubacteriales bacterium]